MAFLLFAIAFVCVFVYVFLGEHLLLGKVDLLTFSWLLALAAFCCMTYAPAWTWVRGHRPPP
jgi:hypothetical protein